MPVAQESVATTAPFVRLGQLCLLPNAVGAKARKAPLRIRSARHFVAHNDISPVGVPVAKQHAASLERLASLGLLK